MTPAHGTEFGDLVRRHRRDRSLTQEELAEQATISVRAISDLERGLSYRPRKDTVQLLADALLLSDDERRTFQLAARRQGAPDPLTLPAGHAGTRQAGDEGVDAPQHLPTGGFLGALPDGALVARTDELSTLLEMVEAVEQRQGRLVLLTGEAGIGKTRLAQEATRVVHGRKFLVAAGRCYEPRRSSVLPVSGGAAYSVRGRACLNSKSGGTPLAVPVAASSGGTEFGCGHVLRGAGRTRVALPRGFRIPSGDCRLRSGCRPFGRPALGRQREPSTPALPRPPDPFEFCPPTGNVSRCRGGSPHPLEATLRELSREQLLQRVTLTRLKQGDTGAFISESMGAIDQEWEFSALVHRHTDGNPYFTQQVLRMLIENGSLYRSGAEWQRREIHEIEVPESVRSVIAQRIARLDQPAQEILHAASVLGPAFTFDDLLTTRPPDENYTELEDAVDLALVGASTLGLVRMTGKDRYAFDHALTQQALYMALSPRRRASSPPGGKCPGKAPRAEAASTLSGACLAFRAGG